MANRNWMNGSKVFTNLTAPTIVNLQFRVDVADPNGMTDLMSNGYVKNVYMHSTDGSPASPNPASGIIAIQLQDNYAALINCMASIAAPVSGAGVNINGTNLTIGRMYVISSLGTSTLADWRAIGLPSGLTPAVGMAFVAIATGDGAGTGTGQVKVVGVSGIQSIELMGNPQLELGPQGVSHQGAWIYLQCLGATATADTAMIPAAPAEDSIISISLLLDNSSVTVDGL